MTKEQFLSLWNADSWEVMSCGVYFTAHRAGKELHINCNDYTEAEILAMPFWERLVWELDELDRQPTPFCKRNSPMTRRSPDLPLTDITIDKSGCYGRFPSVTILGIHRLGNSISMCPFDEQFIPSPEVGYDTF